MFIADKNIGTNHQDRKAEIVRGIIQQFNRLERKAKLIAGIGKTIGDLSEFSESYSEAIIALDAVLANPGSSYMLYHDKLEQSLVVIFMLSVVTKKRRNYQVLILNATCFISLSLWVLYQP